MHDYQEACMAKLEAFLKKVPVIARLRSEELPTILERPASESNSISSALTLDEVLTHEDVTIRKKSDERKESRKKSTASNFIETINSIVEHF